MKSTYSFYAPPQKLFAGVAIVAMLFAAVPVSVVTVEAAPPAPVTICHATGAGTYQQLHVNDNATNGHFDNQGSPDEGHEDDLLLLGHVTCPNVGPIDLCPNINGIQKKIPSGMVVDDEGDCVVVPTTASVTVTKQVVNDDGGEAQVGDFNLFVGATAVESGEAGEVTPGVYQVTETGAEVENYTASFSGDCIEGSLTVVAGESYSCTITNDDKEPTPTYQCSDGLDNDGDGKIDYPTDPGCADGMDDDETDSVNPPTYQCSDGLDNDGDGKVDYPADPGCMSATDDDETDSVNPPTYQCSDGLDNDGDGKVDYPADPGCMSATDDDETDAPVYVCSDGLDNDGDGKIDYPQDPGCSGPTDDDETDTSGQLCVAEPNGGWADFFSDADQKLRKDGSAITDSARTNPGAVTGVADWVSGGSTGFFSLGFGGSITVGFDSYVPNVTGADISIHEATNGVGYPEESAMIEVSQDGELWKEIGTASNQNNLVTRVTFLDFDSTGWSWIKYVRVTDTSDVADFAGSYTSETMPDGFDLDAVDATQTVCDKPAEPVKSCVATLVSGTDSDEDNRDDYTTVDELNDALAWVITPHELWPAITGAGWIWGDEVVQNTALGETQTFERTFGWQGTVTNATLTVSSDDSHSASFNGNFAGSKPSASHVSGQGVYNVTSLIQQGNNILSIEVTNIGNNNPEWNPAGLAYKLVIEGEVARDADCVVPYNDEPLYEIYGYVWHDENENDNWDGSEFDNSESLIEDGELPLAGWTVSITNGTLNFATQTDALGRYEFNVPAGTWTITETMQTNWSQTFPNSGSHVVTVPEFLTEADSEQSFFASVINMLIPTVYAETVYPTSYGAFNFGNVFTGPVITPPTPSSSSRGGNGRRISLQETPRGEVLGASTGLGGALPTPEVLGVATSIVPVGAPNTGAGGSAPQGTTPVIIAILGPTVSLRTTRNG